MREPSVVSDNSVRGARADLVKEGKEPTIRAIQTRLGGGSVSNIHAHLKRIEAEEGPAIPVEADESLRPLLTASRDAIHSAVEAATKNLVARNSALQEDCATVSEELAKKVAALEELEAKLDWLQEVRIKQEAAEKQLKDRVDQLEKEAEERAEERGEAKLAREELAALQAKVVNLTDELATLTRIHETHKAMYETARDYMDPLKDFIERNNRENGEQLALLKEVKEMLVGQPGTKTEPEKKTPA